MRPADVTWRSTSVFVAIGLFAVSYVSPWLADRVFQRHDAPNVWALDQPWAYWHSTVADVVAEWGPYGRDLATILHLTVDVALPLAYAAALVGLIRRIAPSASSPVLRSLPLVPIGAAVADLAENAVIVWVANRPSHPPILEPALWTLSWTKWLLFATAVGLGIFGALRPGRVGNR